MTRHGLFIILMTLLSLNIWAQDDEAHYKQILKRESNDSIRLNALGMLTEIYTSRWEMDSVHVYGTAYMELALGLGDEEALYQAYIMMGTFFDANSDFLLSFDYSFKALDIGERLKNPYFEALAHNNLSWTYVQVGDHQRGVEEGLQAVQSSKKMPQDDHTTALIGFASNNVSIAYLGMGKIDSAIYFNDMALREAVKLEGNNHNQLYCWTMAQYGSIYKKTSDHIRSDSFYRHSLEVADRSGLYQVQVYVLANFCESLNSRGLHREAIAWGRAGLQTGPGKDYYRYAIDLAKQMYTAFTRMGQLDSAVHYANTWMAMSEKLYGEERANKITNLRFSNAIEKAEQRHEEILRKKAEEIKKERQLRNLLLIGIFLVIAIVLLVVRQRNRLAKEKRRSEALLLNILPAEVAEELKRKGESSARRFDEVTILFTDFKEFTQLSERLSPEQLVHQVNHYFKQFDAICDRHGIEKIKTIGDSYMAVGGLPAPQEDAAERVVRAALEMMDFVNGQSQRGSNDLAFQMRAGVHTGNVVAGIVGVKKFQYDIWGDAVNTASRMESHGRTGMVNVSETTFHRIEHLEDLSFEHRGKVPAKGKGDVDMYFVTLG